MGSCRQSVASRRLLPSWARGYRRGDLRGDIGAGLTVGAMLVPQAMAYALLAGLPPAVGLYAATVPVLAYALLGTSRQLAVGPVAIVSLLTASTLGAIATEGTDDYVAAAALLALMVGVVHLVLGFGRLGFLVNFLSHAVLVGFTAAAAIIIGFSQAKHLFGISVERHEHFYEAVRATIASLPDTNSATFAVGVVAFIVLRGLRRLAPRVPAALLVVVVSIVAVEALQLDARGVRVIGEIPNALPSFGVPSLSGGLIADLTTTALVITLVGFMESIAVAKVYARRHGYDVLPDKELIGLGAANVAAGLFGAYPVTGGFSRTAVNDAAGARTPLASVLTAGIVVTTIAFLTPWLSSLPNAALGAIIISAVMGLVDIAEMRHIARLKPSDLVGLGVAFFGTLLLGIELGIAVALVASMLVVFGRMSVPHSAVLGRVPGTTTYRNVSRFPEVETIDGVAVLRIDAALSFVNAQHIKRLVIAAAGEPGLDAPVDTVVDALVLDASGINDIDTTGVEALHDVMTETVERGVVLHLADVKGPVRDVLHRAGIWDELQDRIHASAHEAVSAVVAGRAAPVDQRRHGIDERSGTEAEITDTGPVDAEKEHVSTP